MNAKQKCVYTQIHTFSLSSFSVYTIIIGPKTGLQHIPFTTQIPKLKSLMPSYKFFLLTVLSDIVLQILTYHSDGHLTLFKSVYQ